MRHIFIFYKNVYIFYIFINIFTLSLEVYRLERMTYWVGQCSGTGVLGLNSDSITKYLWILGTLKNILLFMLLQLSDFPPHSPSTQSTHHFHTSTVNLLTVVHVHGSFIYGLWLILSSAFNQSPIPPAFLQCQSVPCFHASGSILLISLFCSLDSTYMWDHIF